MSEPAITLSAWQTAVDRLAGKTNLAASLTSEQWQDVPLAIRDRAFFSATVAEAHRLQEMRTVLQKVITTQDRGRLRPDGSPLSYSSADAIADLRRLWGAEGDSGRLTDINSYRRLKLINDFQTEQAYNYGRWKQDLENPEMLDEYPAWEFVRVEPRQTPRSDWWERWQAAGAAVNWKGATSTAMAALKTSPIWAAFSRFGTPYPPFDFGSGMGLRDLDREEAESIGLIPPDWNPETEGPAAIKHFNANVEASIKDLEPPMREWLEKAMAGKAAIQGDKIVLAPATSPTPLPNPIQPKASSTVSEKFQIDYKGPSALPKTTVTQIKSALEAVDKVHTDGPLNPQPVTRKVSKGSDGTYYVNSDRIGVRPAKTGSEFHFFHELGHRLDYRGMAGGVNSVAANPTLASPQVALAMQRLMKVIDESDAIKKIQTMPTISTHYRKYLLSEHEKFARAYAQFATTESAHPRAIQWLNSVRSGVTGYVKDSQWTDLDFAPIRTEIITLFKTLNWIPQP